MTGHMRLDRVDLYAASLWLLALMDGDRAGADEISRRHRDPGALLAGISVLVDDGRAADRHALEAVIFGG